MGTVEGATGHCMLGLQIGSSPTRPLQVLCLGAHCDDIEIGCAATLALIQRRYSSARFRWVTFCSDATRRDESRAAATTLLGQAVESVFFNHEATRLPEASSEVRTALRSVRDGEGFDVVFCPHRGDRHQDHRLVAELTWNTFRDHLIFEYDVPKYEGDLLSPNIYVPLTREQVDSKARLIVESYPSQAGRHWCDPETFVGLARLRGIEAGGQTRYAEAFRADRVRLALSTSDSA